MPVVVSGTQTASLAQPATLILILRSFDLLGVIAAGRAGKARGQWVEPISTKYRYWTVYELPPNGDGIAALEMLNIMEQFKPGCLTIDVRQMKTLQILGGVWYWWWLYSLSFYSRGGLGVIGLCGRFPKADTGSIGGFRLTRREVIPRSSSGKSAFMSSKPV